MSLCDQFLRFGRSRKAVWVIGRLEAAHALNNQRVRELFPELSVEDGPFENQFSAKSLEWLELFDITDALEICQYRRARFVRSISGCVEVVAGIVLFGVRG